MFKKEATVGATERCSKWFTYSFNSIIKDFNYKHTSLAAVIWSPRKSARSSGFCSKSKMCWATWSSNSSGDAPTGFKILFLAVAIYKRNICKWWSQSCGNKHTRSSLASSIFYKTKADSKTVIKYMPAVLLSYRLKDKPVVLKNSKHFFHSSS